MFGSNMQQKNIRIRNFILVQTGTYQEQHLRPFNVNVTSQNVNDLEEVTKGGRNLGVASVQEIASNIIAPAANTEGLAGVENGWSSRRFRFMLTVEESHPFISSSTTQRVYFGYTDHCDASFNHLDPNMRIYFNSETVINNVMEQTPAGPVMRSRLLASNQIVAPVDVAQGPTTIYANPTTHLIRPEDVFSLAQSSLVARKLESQRIVDGKIDLIVDNRANAGLGNEYKYTRRQDSSPVRYLSNVLNAYQHAVKESSTESFDGVEDIYSETLLGEAVAQASNIGMRTNAFLSMLRDHCGYMEYGYVTFAQLNQLFPETMDSQVTNFSMDNGRSIRKISHAADSEVFTGADNESIAVSLIAQTTPSVMMDNLFRSIGFTVTNGSGMNQYLIDINPNMTKTVVTISPDMIQNYILEFERRLKIDILNIISQGNQIPFKLIVSSDLAGDTIIDIALGNDPLTRYIAPTFSDALFAPVITKDIRLANQLSNDMTFLVSNVIDGRKHQMYQENVFVNYTHPQQTNFITEQGDNNVDLGLL